MSDNGAMSDSLSSSRASWLAQAGWGVMFHYIDQPASSTVISTTSADAWARRVDRFDVERFCRDIRSLGAGYVIFTVGQNTGHYCAPNPVYDELTGLTPSLLSSRDLIAEIAAELAPEVKLIAYLPSGAPVHHEPSVRALRCTPPWDASAWGLTRTWPDEESADERLSAFQQNWEAVIRCWGQQWGCLVAGWWIDGCYFSDRMYGHADAPNFASLAQALRTGNPDRILAFNAGTDHASARLTVEQDYAAGEVSTQLPVGNKWAPFEGEIAGMQNHVLSYLGDWWGSGEPRFSAAFVQQYTSYLNERNVAVTWDVPILNDGRIPEAFLEQLGPLAKARSPLIS